MSDAKGNQEPSMEEILASIRRIISEDGEPKEEPAAPAVNGHAAEEPEDDDALVLTDMVVGDSNVVELKEEPAPAPAAPQAAAPMAPPPSPVAPEPEVQPEPAAPAPEDSAEDIELDVAEPEMPVAEPVAAAAAAEAESLADDGMPAEPAAIAEMPLEGDLVSPDVAAASAATMAQLVARKPLTGQARATSIDGLLVETLVRQAIEPMLKEWLDEHLQEIVERLVRREVERLSRKAELS